MDTFIIYHEVLMSLTAHMYRETPLNPEAVTTEVATNLGALEALLGSNSQPCGLTLPVDTKDAAIQYEEFDINQQNKCKERPVCIVTPLGFSEKFMTKPTTLDSAVPSGSGNQHLVAAPNTPVAGPRGIQTSTSTTATTTGDRTDNEVDSQLSQSPLSYYSYEMISDSDSDSDAQ